MILIAVVHDFNFFVLYRLLFCVHKNFDFKWTTYRIPMFSFKKVPQKPYPWKKEELKMEFLRL